MEMKRTAMKNVAVMVLLTMLLSVFAGALPGNFAVNAATVTELRMDVRTTAGNQVTFTAAPGVTLEGSWGSSTGLAGSSSSVGSLWTKGGSDNSVYALYQPNKSGSTLEAGTYDVYFWYVYHSDNEMNLKAEVLAGGETATVDQTALTALGGSEAGWVKVGTYDFTGAEEEYLKLTATAYARIADVKFKKSSGGEPTSEPSKEPIPTPSFVPSTATWQENFNTATPESSFAGEGWSVGTDISATVKEKTSGDNYLNLAWSANGVGVKTPSMALLNNNQDFVGNNMIATFKFNIENLAGDGRMFILRTRTSKIAVHLDMDLIDNTSYCFSYRENPADISEKKPFDSTFDFKKWYQVIIDYDSQTGTYDIYFRDENGACIEYKEGIHARYNTADTNGIVDINRIETNEFKTGDILNLDDFYIANDPDYQLPDVSDIPTASPIVIPLINENFDDLAQGAYAGSDFSKGTTTTADVTAEDSNQYLHIAASADEAGSFRTKNFNSWTGENLIVALKFRVAADALPGDLMFLTKSSANDAIGVISISATNGLTVASASTSSSKWGTSVPVYSGEWGTGWYQLITKYNTNTSKGTIDVYLCDEDGNLLGSQQVDFRGTSGTVNAKNLQYLMFNNFSKGTAIDIDDVYVADDPNYKLPDTPDLPSPSPETDVIRMDVRTENANVADFTPAKGIEVKGSWHSGTGMTASDGKINTLYTDSVNAYVKYSPTEVAGDKFKAGWYDVSFWNIAHESTNPIHLKAEVSGAGILTTDIELPTAVGSSRWDKIGTYYFDNEEEAYLKLICTDGRARVADVKFVYADDQSAEKPTPTPTPSPTPVNTFYYDDDSADCTFVNVPNPLQAGQEKGTSNTGSARGGTHAYCNIPGSYALYTLNELPAGEYEVYFDVPLVHANNTTDMFAEVTDSNGKTFKGNYDIQEAAGKSGVNAAGDIKTGTYIRLGETFTFMPDHPGTVKLGKEIGAPNGHYRADAIKLVRVKEYQVPPRARDLSITGALLRPGGVLTGNYTYVQDNRIEEKDSVKKWFRADSENGPWTEIAQGDTYTLTAADGNRYIKFEVTPKCDSEDTAIQTGKTESTVIGPIPDKDEAGIASGLAIIGIPLQYRDIRVSYSYSDSNLDPEGDSTYQWYYCDEKGENRTPISGANGSCKAGDVITRTITAEDIGNYITIGITVKSSNLSAEYFASPVSAQNMPQVKPIARRAAIAGTMTTDRPINAFYVYSHEYGMPEGNSAIQWYVGDSADGPFTAIPGATEKQYQATDDQMYKYIKFSVTPVTAETNIAGDTVESEPKQIKYELVFADEFDYTAANGNDPKFKENWVPANENPGHIQSARYPENIKVEDGMLKLIQKYEPGTADGTKDWTSGSCWTKDTYGYGHYEARYKWAHASGLNQSFWAMTPGGYMQDGGYEIDVNEGHYPKTLQSNFHFKDNTTGEHISLGKKYTPDYVDTMADDFHIYELDWNEDEILMYCDGQLYRRQDNYMCDPTKKEAYFYFSIAVMMWAGEVTMEIDGTEVDVDYFRQYKLADDDGFADTERLQDEISRAENILSEAQAGSSVGNYPKSAIDSLQAAVDTAKGTLGDSAVTTDKAYAAAKELNTAIIAFFDKMVTTGVLTANSPEVIIPSEYGKEIMITNTSGSFDAKLKMKEGALVSKDIKIITSLRINGKVQQVVMTIPAGLQFTGTVENGYVVVDLPKLVSSLEGASVPGSSKGVISMGAGGITLPISITIPDAGDLSVGYVNMGGVFEKVTAQVSKNELAAASADVPTDGMGTIVEGIQQTVWMKYLSDIVIYEPKDTPTDRPNIVGKPNPPYYPDEKPSPSPSEEPTVSPSTEPTNNPVDFKDIKDHWAEKEIVELAEQDIIKGVTEDEFMPDKSITRAEFTALIVRTLGLDVVDYKNEFSDVKETDWFAKEIQTALENGIISKDEMFRPNDTMTREEMTKVMVEALKKATGEENLEKADLNQFKDAEEISGWAKEYVAEALHTGLIKGISEDEFSPKTNATRAQGAVMIHRLLGMIAKG